METKKLLLVILLLITAILFVLMTDQNVWVVGSIVFIVYTLSLFVFGYFMGDLYRKKSLEDEEYLTWDDDTIDAQLSGFDDE